MFTILTGLALAFWLYTQMIIDHVREFQKSVIRTQKDIYVDIINPYSPYTTSVSSDLFQTGVIESPFPIIFSDVRNEPIQGQWRNVGLAVDDTTLRARRKLKKMIYAMDRINPPDSMYMPDLIPRTDTLTVYEQPPSILFPVAVTDQVGILLYSRNIQAISDGSRNVMSVINTLDSNPVRFIKDGEPPLIFYGLAGRRQWPVIVTSGDGTPLYWRDVDVSSYDTSSPGQAKLSAHIGLMRQRGMMYRVVTNQVAGQDTLLFHYGDPVFLSWIMWLPVIEFLVIFILISIGYIGFRNITKAEQRSIWVGMAKETAHQLGTPISSIDGWLELMKTDRDPALFNQALTEIDYDVKRLTRVVSRFSNIGSRPELQPLQLSGVIEEVLDYFRTRVPRMGQSVVLENSYTSLAPVLGNRELLNWAFENLVKNALASIDKNDGRITVTGSMTKNHKHVLIDVADNGKGIPSRDQKKIMKPGFTTKKRGWGLGLSLVKRIIEDYHGGKITLMESIPGQGSTFRVQIPAVTGYGGDTPHETVNPVG